jgi:hypothetical protein
VNFNIANEGSMPDRKCESTAVYGDRKDTFTSQIGEQKCNPEFYFKNNTELFSIDGDLEKDVASFRDNLLKAEVINDINIYRDILAASNQLVNDKNNNFSESSTYIRNKELTTEFNKFIKIFQHKPPYNDAMKKIVDTQLYKIQKKSTSSSFNSALDKLGTRDASSFAAASYSDAVSYASLYKQIITESILPELKKEYFNIMCDVIRLDKLSYNCTLRRNEGYMINQSLAELRRDIQVLIKQSLETEESGTVYNPIFYEKYIFPYCRNVNLNDNYFDFFLKSEPKDNRGNPLELGILAKIMSNPTDHSVIKGFGIDLKKINFGVFTVINLTNKLAAPYVNNPPNPPYINLNDIVMSMMNNNIGIKDSCSKLKEKLNKYTFYKSIINAKPLSNLNKDSPDNDELLEVINLIKSNNAATLIGSLEGTEVLQNTAYTKLVCSYESGVSPTSGKFDAITLLDKDVVPLEILNP